MRKQEPFKSFQEARNFIEENLGENFSAYRHLDKKEYYVVEEVDSANAKFISHNRPTELKVVGKIELKQPKENELEKYKLGRLSLIIKTYFPNYVCYEDFLLLYSDDNLFITYEADKRTMFVKSTKDNSLIEKVKFSRKGLKNFLSFKINYVKTKYEIK